MKLFYHNGSAFARKVWACALEHNLADQIELHKVVVAPVHYPGWSDDNDQVAKANPVAKIPCLIVDGMPIFDSRVIVEYFESLDKSFKPVENIWREKTNQALVDAMMDAEVLCVYEDKIRFEAGVKYDPWHDGQRKKITRSLDRLESEAKDDFFKFSEQVTVASPSHLALASVLPFFDIRGIMWREGRPALTKWYNNWIHRDSWVKSRPELDWKTGEPPKEVKKNFKAF